MVAPRKYPDELRERAEGCPGDQQLVHAPRSKWAQSTPAFANPARLWDSLLGGKDNCAVDREAAGQVLALLLTALRRGRTHPDIAMSRAVTATFTLASARVWSPHG